jgi:hypothetical protein
MKYVSCPALAFAQTLGVASSPPALLLQSEGGRINRPLLVEPQISFRSLLHQCFICDRLNNDLPPVIGGNS